MKIIPTFFLYILLMPAVVLAQLDTIIQNLNFLGALQIALLLIAAGSSVITTIMVIELFQTMTRSIQIKDSEEVEKCPKCGKKALVKDYDGLLLTSFTCRNCKYEAVKEKDIPEKTLAKKENKHLT